MIKDIDINAEKALQAYADLKRIPLTKVLRNAGRDFVQVGLQLTPIYEGDVWRVWANAPPRGKTVRSNHIWLPDSPHRESLIKAKLAKPLAKGLAKGSWKGAFKALGMGSKTEYDQMSKQAVSSAVWTGDEDGGNVCLTITDFTHYQMPKYDNLNNKILDAGYELASKRIINDWKRCIDSTWNFGKMPENYL